MMNEKKHGIGHNIRQAVLVTVVLLVLCGLVFPVLLFHNFQFLVEFPSQLPDLRIPRVNGDESIGLLRKKPRELAADLLHILF